MRIIEYCILSALVDAVDAVDVLVERFGRIECERIMIKERKVLSKEWYRCKTGVLYYESRKVMVERTKGFGGRPGLLSCKRSRALGCTI